MLDSVTAMEPSCKFGLTYEPLGKRVDPVVRQHLANCPDCQQQVALV